MNKKTSRGRVSNASLPKKAHDKYCGFCKSGSDYVDYKNVSFLLTFVNKQGKILPARYTGNCPKHQRKVAKGVKRARELHLVSHESKF